MASFNRTVLLGNLTKDPELRYLTSGKAVCEVAIAVNETYKDGNGEKVENVSFIDCVFWSRTAEVLHEFLRKGDAVLLEGRLKQDRYEKDGVKKSKLKVVVEQMKMIGGKRTNNDQAVDSAEPVGAGAGSDNDSF